MTKLFQNYKRESIEFIKAADNYLVDKEGNFYLDFSSGIGVTNLGFHKQVKQAVSEQLEPFGIVQISIKIVSKNKSQTY